MIPSPTPDHQTISLDITLQIANFVRENSVGKILTAPIDFYLSDENYVVPDLIFLSPANASITLTQHVRGIPDLIIEIASRDKKRDYIEKKDLLRNSKYDNIG